MKFKTLLLGLQGGHPGITEITPQNGDKFYTVEFTINTHSAEIIVSGFPIKQAVIMKRTMEFSDNDDVEQKIEDACEDLFYRIFLAGAKSLAVHPFVPRNGN